MEISEELEAQKDQCHRCKHLVLGIKCEEATHIGQIHEMWPIDDVIVTNGEMCECFEELIKW
jgi:hypothetical protein